MYKLEQILGHHESFRGKNLELNYNVFNEMYELDQILRDHESFRDKNLELIQDKEFVCQFFIANRVLCL